MISTSGTYAEVRLSAREGAGHVRAGIKTANEPRSSGVASSQTFSADNMNNAAGILQYWQNRNWRPLPTRGKRLKSDSEQVGFGYLAGERDTNYLNGRKGLLKTRTASGLDAIISAVRAEKI